MSFSRLFKRNPEENAADLIYGELVAQARSPAFYLQCGVPDSVSGRWEMIQLHAFMVLHRLKADHDRTRDLAQRLFDTVFANLDQNMRELGVGDLSVGKKVKRMAQGFYGRVSAYDAGLNQEGSADALYDALVRNLYGGAVPSVGPAAVEAMAAYMLAETSNLAEQSIELILEGKVRFGAPPAGPVSSATDD